MRIKTYHRPYNDIVSHLSQKRTLQTTKSRGASILWANQSGVTLHLSPVLYLTGFILCPRVYIFKNPREKRNISKCLLLESRGFLYRKLRTLVSSKMLLLLVSSKVLLLLVSSKMLLLLLPSKMLLLLLPSKMAVVCHRCGKRFITTKQQLAVGNQALVKETPLTWCML